MQKFTVQDGNPAVICCSQPTSQEIPSTLHFEKLAYTSKPVQTSHFCYQNYLQSTLSHQFLGQSAMKRAASTETGSLQAGNSSISRGTYFPTEDYDSWLGEGRRRDFSTRIQVQKGFEKRGCSNHKSSLAIRPGVHNPSASLQDKVSALLHTQYNSSEVIGCSKASCNRYRNSSVSHLNLSAEEKMQKTQSENSSSLHFHTGMKTATTIFVLAHQLFLASEREATVSNGSIAFDKAVPNTITVPKILCH